jgi:hypothetical protein
MIAVEESDRIIPTVREVCQLKPKRETIAKMTSVVITTCKPPNPNIGTLILRSSFGSSSRPMTNNIITTPNSEKCMMSWRSSPTKPNRAGPIIIPATR